MFTNTTKDKSKCVKHAIEKGAEKKVIEKKAHAPTCSSYSAVSAATPSLSQLSTLLKAMSQLRHNIYSHDLVDGLLKVVCTFCTLEEHMACVPSVRALHST